MAVKQMSCCASSGMTTIRAWGYEERFTDMVRTRANDYTRPFYLIWAANRWLCFRVEFYAATVTLFAGMFIIWNIDSLDAGQAGFSMTYALTLTDTILVCGQLEEVQCVHELDCVDEVCWACSF